MNNSKLLAGVLVAGLLAGGAAHASGAQGQLHKKMDEKKSNGCGGENGCGEAKKDKKDAKAAVAASADENSCKGMKKKNKHKNVDAGKDNSCKGNSCKTKK